MMIYQVHDFHGKHIAYNTNEADYNEKNGWKTVSKDEFYGAIKEKDVVDNDIELTEEEAKAEYIKIFGKKPHHKMKPETIIEKINAHST